MERKRRASRMAMCSSPMMDGHICFATPTCWHTRSIKSSRGPPCRSLCCEAPKKSQWQFPWGSETVGRVWHIDCTLPTPDCSLVSLFHGFSMSDRILVVDDNRDAADSLAKLIRSLGHEVKTVYDGTRAPRES